MDILTSEFSDYEELVRPTQNPSFSQSPSEGESVEATLVPPQVFSSQNTKKNRIRTKNFTKQEDEMLISAWQNVSLDPVTGADQTTGTYWQRVHNYFMKHKEFESNRNVSSLTHRWSMIQLGVNKFHGFYNQFDGRSGYSELDKIDGAKKMYKEVYKTSFSLEHCWNLLRHLPKWNTEFATKKSKARKESPTSPSSPECVMLEKSELERPIGRKAAKELQKKRKRPGMDCDDNSGAAILEQMRVELLESRKQRNEHLKEMMQLAKEKEERERRREEKEQDEADAKIMAMDTRSMGAIEAEYFNSRKQEIMERRRARFF
ncbi:glutathione S-transferase T3-like [Daucus carota subsp. sativus]|nr:PREDICTED: glutathione S-transferase T3-like [Daucus carota subsp. sativus]